MYIPRVHITSSACKLHWVRGDICRCFITICHTAESLSLRKKPLVTLQQSEQTLLICKQASTVHISQHRAVLHTRSLLNEGCNLACSLTLSLENKHLKIFKERLMQTQECFSWSMIIIQSNNQRECLKYSLLSSFFCQISTLKYNYNKHSRYINSDWLMLKIYRHNISSINLYLYLFLCVRIHIYVHHNRFEI